MSRAHEYACKCEHEQGEVHEVCGCGHEQLEASACDASSGHEHGCGCGCGCGETGEHEHGCGCGCGETGEHEHGCGCGCEHEHEQTGFQTFLLASSGVALAVGLVCEHLIKSEQLASPAYALAAILGLIFIAPLAASSLRRRKLDMNVLMSLAVIGALIMGFMGDTEVFGDAAIVIFLNQIGEWLEGWSMRRSTSSIRELIKLAPERAHVIRDDGTTYDLLAAEVEEGQHIRVLAGERLPLDGVILAGSSSFNEAPVTGESIPKDKSVGDEVFAGSLNAAAVVDIEVTADSDCSMLARIVSLVQGAQAQRAPYESFVNRFAARYTPMVIVLALVVGLGVPSILSLRGSFDPALWQLWTYRALSLLVLACPCALVISTPVSFVSAITRAARSGVLVKGGAHFDVASRLSAIAFDKTGTLTCGTPQVTRLICTGETSEDKLVALAAALERNSTHPLAAAVVAYAQERLAGSSLLHLNTQDVEEFAGAGIRGMVALEGSGTMLSCAVGKADFACGTQLTQEVSDAIEELGHEGASSFVLSCEGAPLGVIGVADVLRQEAPSALRELKESCGILKLVMLTGDNEHTAVAVARQAGMTAAFAGLLPHDKVLQLQKMQEAKGTVAMVGDGINDTPALAASDLAITMGAVASDAALELADVALLGNDLRLLPFFLRLSKRTMRVVRSNIAFAIGVKLLVFVLVIMGVAGMGAAVFADTGVALLVILNGMRLMIVE